MSMKLEEMFNEIQQQGLNSAKTGTLSGVISFTGANTHTGVETHTGAETHTGVETHSGAETHSGLEVFSGGQQWTSPTVGVGYATGAGGTVTQATNRTTGVTINKLTGTITTNNASLAAEAAAAFVVTNSTVAIGDVIILSQQSGAVGAMTTVEVVAVAAGSFTISVMNNNPAAGTAETGAILINFAVIKAVSA